MQSHCILAGGRILGGASAFGIQESETEQAGGGKTPQLNTFWRTVKKDLGPKSDCSWSKIKSNLSLSIREERQIMIVRVRRAIALLFTSWLGADLSKISLDRIIYCLKKKKKLCSLHEDLQMPDIRHAGAQPNLLWLALKWDHFTVRRRSGCKEENSFGCINM